jgi:hypothetical protein
MSRYIYISEEYYGSDGVQHLGMHPSFIACIHNYMGEEWKWQHGPWLYASKRKK